MNNKDATLVFIFLLVSILLIFQAPIIIIWAMNNLFFMNIPVNWKTWLSVYILWTALSLAARKENEQQIKYHFFGGKR